jgi:hypothetical protein
MIFHWQRERISRVLKNPELTVIARRKATKETRTHASTCVNGVLLAEMSSGLLRFARYDGPGIVFQRPVRADVIRRMVLYSS